MAKKDLFLWNKTCTASVRASKIRSITIFERPYPGASASNDKAYWEILGWYNANEWFNFGEFPSREEAVTFVNGLHEAVSEG